MTTISRSRLLRVASLFLPAMILCSVSAHAESDLTIFGGIQRQGRLTFDSAPSTTSNFVTTFDPRTFGVFGGRFSHGKVIGGEHSVAFAPNFIDSGSRAFIYHSNVKVQIPIPVVKPYATAGVGFVNSSGNAVTAFGTEFAVNYGGGVKLTAGPFGVNLDVRGYTLPTITTPGFNLRGKLNFLQTSAGLMWNFK